MFSVEVLTSCFTENFCNIFLVASTAVHPWYVAAYFNVMLLVVLRQIDTCLLLLKLKDTDIERVEESRGRQLAKPVLLGKWPSKWCVWLCLLL